MRYKDEDGMKNRYIQTAIVLAAAAGLLILLFFAVKTKKLQINRWIVSDRDVIGADISTEGSGHVDSRFDDNWENAQECGLPAGAYHFFSFDSPGEMQADNYIQAVGSLKGKLIPAVDVEYYGDKKENPPKREDVVRELRAFLDALEKEYQVRPLIYCSGDVYEKYILKDFREYPRWVRSIYYPVTFEAGGNWVVWQYCDTAELEGYEGGERCIDLNVLNRGRSLEDLKTGQQR